VKSVLTTRTSKVSIIVNGLPLSAQSYGAHLVVGVDIDDTLISGAWRRRRAVWSMQEPTMHKVVDSELADTVSSSRKKRKLDHSTEIKESVPMRCYFPASCEHEFGSLPIPPSSIRSKFVFPHNVTFRTADWVHTAIHEDSEGYDVILGWVSLFIMMAFFSETP